MLLLDAQPHQVGQDRPHDRAVRNHNSRLAFARIRHDLPDRSARPFALIVNRLAFRRHESFAIFLPVPELFRIFRDNFIAAHPLENAIPNFTQQLGLNEWHVGVMGRDGPCGIRGA